MKALKLLLYPLLLAVFVAYEVWFDFPAGLHETAAMTPFLGTGEYAAQVMGCPGGVLTYVSAWLATTMATPAVGTLALVFALLLMAYALRWAARLTWHSEALAWAAAAIMVAGYTAQGYMLYVSKSPGVCFSMPLGLGAAALTAGVCTRMRRNSLAVPATFLAHALAYYIIGAYALVSALMVLVWRPRRYLLVLSAVLSVVVVPQLLYPLGLCPCDKADLYTLGLPDWQWNSAAERKLFIPLAVAAILSLVMPVFGKASRWQPRPVALLSVVALAGFAWWAHSHAFRDANYRCIVQMKHAADHELWDEILRLARANAAESQPTRVQVMLTRLALFKTGRAGDEMFAYPDGDTPYEAQRPYQYLRAIAGRTLYMHYGKVNYAYRWSMEDMVEYGPCPDYVQYLYRCAVLNGEEALAARYAAVLHQMPHATVPELSQSTIDEVRELMNYSDLLDGDGGMIERYLLNSYATMDGGTRPMVEQALLCSMVTKDIGNFWKHFVPIARSQQGALPRHYQEAALLFATLSGAVDPASLPVAPEIRASFERLVQQSTANASRGDAYNAQALRGEFGSTYWYYYFFVKTKTQ